MKKLGLFVFLVLALALAMSAFSAVLGSDGGNITSHQISGVLEGTIEFVPFPYATTLLDVDSLGHASGIINGLGRSNMFTFQRPDPFGNFGDVMDGRVKIVTASHDILQGEYIGTTVPDPYNSQGVIGSAEFVINGGTGRFANANGTIQATAYATFEGDMMTDMEWEVVWFLEGTVDY